MNKDTIKLGAALIGIVGCFILAHKIGSKLGDVMVEYVVGDSKDINGEKYLN